MTRVAAVIPARGGSKGVPGKNLRRVGGVSLIERAVLACRSAQRIDDVYVSTDDPDIAYAAELAGAEVIVRPPQLAGDRATSESALLHALTEIVPQPQALVFVQCTSPFIDPATLDEGVRLVTEGQADSVFSAVPSHAFLWQATTTDGVPLVRGLNHDSAVRLRRQDLAPEYRETGAFYVMDVAGLLRHEHRFFGRIAPVAVNPTTAIDIDTVEDLQVAEALAPLHVVPAVPLQVDVVFTDFDGVHTDDAAYVDQNGVESVRVSRADGLGIEQLRAAGVPMVIVSKERNPVVGARAAKLRLEVAQGIEDKAGAVRAWLELHRVPAARAAYLGNDVNDAAPMRMVGWPIAVADARPEIRALARLTLTRPGGQGAVRELCDLVVAARAAHAAPPAGPGRESSSPAPEAAAGSAAYASAGSLLD